MSNQTKPVIHIRVADAGDAEAIFVIRTSVTQNHLSREQLADLGITLETVIESLRGTDARAWIAEVEGVPAASAMANNIEGSVFAMFVHPEYEGRGLGRLLMERVEAYLFERHPSIWLVTDGRPEIRANGFYQKLGWTLDEHLEHGDVKYVKGRPPL